MIKKLININQKVTLDKTKHLKFEKKFNNLSQKVRLNPEKGLTKYLINGHSVLNGAQYFKKEESQNISTTS